MFIDEAKINIKAGDGGNGLVSFFYSKGSRKKIASGGNGGRGGNIIIQATSRLNTLYGFRKKIHFKAQNGFSGIPNNKNGRDGEDLTIQVPIGTIIKDERGEILADLRKDSEKAIIVRGGICGRGNANFISQKRRFPSFAEKGEKVEEMWINLELRLIADVALVGFPNAGKSTLISKISAARPKIADYPFTTIVPNLGVVSVDDETFIVADIPGIIKDAHMGTGLGDKFLRHILRSKVLLIILDGQTIVIDKNTTGYIDIIRSFKILREEIKLYDKSLYKKDFIIAINKIDLISDRQVLQALKEKLERKSGKKAFLISAVTGEGLNELIWTLYKKIGEYESKPGDEDTYGFEKQQEIKIYNIETTRLKDEKIDIKKIGDEYIVKNKKLERIVAMTNLDNEEALEYLENRLKKMRIGDRLKKLGIKEGSSVIIGDLVFELKE